MVGQQHVVRTLRNAVDEDKVHHAYLFVGSRGTGKTSMAKILASTLNCSKRGSSLEACGECESCRAIAAGTSVDVIEMDAASNRSVDDVRDLRERVAYAPLGGHWKVYILDEAHMLTKEAWNAFLKTLEEPPPNTVFVLATTESHKVMATIADRCQRFDFQRPSLEQISEVLDRVAAAEGIEVEAGATSMIARSASGSFRDALGTLDQLVSFGGKTVGLDDVHGAARRGRRRAALRGCRRASSPEDPKGVLLGVEKMARSGRDPAQFARDLLSHLRHLLVDPDDRRGSRRPSSSPRPTRGGSPPRPHAIGAATLVRTIDELAAALDRGAGGRRCADGGRDRAAQSRAARPRPVGRGAASEGREAWRRASEAGRPRVLSGDEGALRRPRSVLDPPDPPPPAADTAPMTTPTRTPLRSPAGRSRRRSRGRAE